MKKINKLYEGLMSSDSTAPSSFSIDSEVRAKIYKAIFKDLDELREKQRNLKSHSDDYGRLDRQIRLRLLKEIQVIIDEYIMAKNSQDLDRWNTMYGDIEIYKRNFFYYRMDGKYEAKKKVLTDYRFA
ncbi:MAG: hypothetical protein ABID54_12050 [Pseudomonadota bacterium]